MSTKPLAILTSLLGTVKLTQGRQGSKFHVAPWHSHVTERCHYEAKCDQGPEGHTVSKGF